MPLRIEDYALIGDCETAALVGRNGSMDWLCFPRFDSPACFAALLGTPENGRWLLQPRDEVREVRRRYRDGTLILETDFATETGVARLIDFMPLRTKAADVVRIVEGVSGEVAMRMNLTIRFDYGSIVPWVRRTTDGIYAIAGPDILYLHSETPVHGEDLQTVGEFVVREGQRIPFTLIWYPSHLEEPPRIDPLESLSQTEQWWREWSSGCTYDGLWRKEVVRSLITLKALTYAPTGGHVAAPTTSLPEKLGGVRNWDYRYCWIRDATFTLGALMVGGYLEEARRWREWLVRAVAGKPSQIQIMYGIAGERRLPELELPWLAGYENSAPVRIGNAASTQHQLDVYGEVLDALAYARQVGLEPDENAWRVQKALLNFLESDWQKPDEGIWESRGPSRNFTHSKIMAWVAMDRGVKAVKAIDDEGLVERWSSVRDKIRADVLQKGFDADLNTFVQYYGAKEVDASLLMIPMVGFLPATDPRMLGTVAKIEDQLMYDGLLQRYRTAPMIDGLPPGEGAFLVCSFWLADNYALQGRVAEARALCERLLGLANDVGLFAEEYDPVEKRMLGNFPQALSHMGVIITARNISKPGGPADQRRGL
jgi:GH15 family glucan-1,4-alpha-glucosidase